MRSLIHSIHRGIDVARAMDLPHVAAATGSTSEAAVKHLYGLPEAALIDMGDFAGGTLGYRARIPVPRLTLAGGFGKLVKLAQGHLFCTPQSHGWISPCSPALLGEDPGRRLQRSRTRRRHALQRRCWRSRAAYHLPLADRVAERAGPGCPGHTRGDGPALEVLVFDRSAQPIRRAPPEG